MSDSISKGKLRQQTSRRILRGGCFLAALIVCALTLAGAGKKTGSISGEVSCDNAPQGDVIVRLLQWGPKGIFRSQIYGPETSKNLPQGFVKDQQEIRLKKPGPYRFTHLANATYAVVAFIDRNGDGTIGFDPVEPFNFHPTAPGGIPKRIKISDSDEKNIDVHLRAPTPFPTQEKRTEHGALKWIKGRSVLQLWGNARQRGFAHGFLIGPQIIDFLEFYVIDDGYRSASNYQSQFVPFIESNFSCPKEMLEECDAVIAGMKASGMNMRVGSLGRDFTRTDLLAINAYTENRARQSAKSSMECSQFAFWGPLTEKSPLKGGLVAGRNMEGECDIHKMTTMHALLFAVDPSELGHHRWVSLMWPGFVGTLTGINEKGLYCMVDGAPIPEGPIVGGIVPGSWTIRSILEKLGDDATPKSVGKIIDRYKCKGGGTLAAGHLMLVAKPSDGKRSSAFVYEGDRFGGVFRLPGEVAPTDPNCIFVTNSFLRYKQTDPASCDRYKRGLDLFQQWEKAGTAVGVPEAIKMAQTLSYQSDQGGSAEHSIIFLANEMRILVAVDDLKPDACDAPFLPWTDYSFEELFR